MARVADILGSSLAARIPRQWAINYQVLCDMRERLTARNGGATGSSFPEVGDSGDAASSEVQWRAAIEASVAASGSVLEIVAALKRIEHGTYGICEVTGLPIEPARLRLMPWARTSISGQRQLEARACLDLAAPAAPHSRPATAQH